MRSRGATGTGDTTCSGVALGLCGFWGHWGWGADWESSGK